MDENQKKDLTGVLKALESNNVRLPQEEIAKREAYTRVEGAEASSSLIQPLRTFEGDSAEAIKEGKQSIYSIRKAEEKKHPERQQVAQNNSSQSRRNTILLVGSALLFVIGASIVLFFFLLRNTTETPAPITQAAPTLITDQGSVDISYDPQKNTSILDLVNQTISQKQSNPGDITSIHLVQNGEKVSATTLISNLSPRVPGSLLRSVDPSLYAFGTVQDTNQDLFLILRINDYNNAFAGMLQWESSLGTIFGTGVQGNFQDAIVKNKDVRILQDVAGNTHLLYGFYDKKTLVITTNETAFATLLLGLRSAVIVQ